MYYYYSLYVKILHYVCTIITLRNPGNPHKYWILVIFFFFSFLSGGFGICSCSLGQVQIPGFAQPSDLEKSRILSRVGWRFSEKIRPDLDRDISA